MKWYKIANKIDPKELAMGIKVEKEHLDVYKEIKKILGKDTPWTLDEFTEKIAKAHLKEIKNYYTLLKKMEKDAKK